MFVEFFTTNVINVTILLIKQVTRCTFQDNSLKPLLKKKLKHISVAHSRTCQPSPWYIGSNLDKNSCENSSEHQTCQPHPQACNDQVKTYKTITYVDRRL